MTTSLVRWSRDHPKLWRLFIWLCPLLDDLNYSNDHGWIRCKVCDRALEYFDFLWPKSDHVPYTNCKVKGEALCPDCRRQQELAAEVAEEAAKINPNAEPEEEKPPALHFPDPGNMWFGDEDGPPVPYKCFTKEGLYTYDQSIFRQACIREVTRCYQLLRVMKSRDGGRDAAVWERVIDEWAHYMNERHILVPSFTVEFHKNPPPEEKVTITKHRIWTEPPNRKILYLQACAQAYASNEEILAECNAITFDPPVVWDHVHRVNAGWCEVPPHRCAEHPGRLHFLVTHKRTMEWSQADR